MCLDDWLLRSLVRVILLSDPQFRLYRSFVSRQRHGPVACCYSSACFSTGRPCRRCCGETNRLSDIPGLSGSPRSAAQACASLVLARWDSRRPLLQCVPVGDSVRQALRWWSSRAHVLFGQTLSQFRPQVTTYSDASLLGWGTLLDAVTGSGSWPPLYRTLAIHWLELKTIQLALLLWLQHCGTDMSYRCASPSRGGVHRSARRHLVTEFIRPCTRYSSVVSDADHPTPVPIRTTMFDHSSGPTSSAWTDLPHALSLPPRVRHAL